MQVSVILNYIDKIITKTITEYTKSEEAYKENDVGQKEYINHPLDETNVEDRILNIDLALKDVALKTTPISLLETVGSTATVFKRISMNEFVRLPNTPTADGELDIDDGLAFAVMYKALSFMWDGYSSYSSDADEIANIYNDATREFFINRESGEEFAINVLFRFSSDNVNFHDNYMDGDIYISFRSGTGDWSAGVRFVGQDGADGEAGTGSGGGATTFVELTDTPSTLTEGKFLAVGAESKIVEVDAPAGGGASNPDFDAITGSDMVSGTVSINLMYDSGNKATHFVYLAGDCGIDISKTNGTDYDMEQGRIYTIIVLCDGFNATLDFIALGDTTIDTTAYSNVYQILYDGFDVYVLSHNIYNI